MGNEYFWQVPGQGLYARSMHSAARRAGASGDGSQRAASKKSFDKEPGDQVIREKPGKPGHRNIGSSE